MGVPDAPDLPDLSESRNHQPVLSDYNNSNDDEMNEMEIDFNGGNSYVGYALLDDVNGQMLQQDMDDDEDFEASSDDESEGEDGETAAGGLEDGVRIWNEPRQVENIVLDTTKTAEILNVMNNFKLPPSSIPVWARDIPEDQWKEDLLQKIRIRQNPIAKESEEAAGSTSMQDN